MAVSDDGRVRDVWEDPMLRAISALWSPCPRTRSVKIVCTSFPARRPQADTVSAHISSCDEMTGDFAEAVGLRPNTASKGRHTGNYGDVRLAFSRMARTIRESTSAKLASSSDIGDEASSRFRYSPGDKEADLITIDPVPSQAFCRHSRGRDGRLLPPRRPKVFVAI